MASAPVLSHVHTLGLSPEVLSHLHFVDENVVLYPAGHSVVIYNVEKKTQRFIFGSEGSRITTLALSPNRRFVAIAEASDRAIITIFDVQTLRKRKVIMSGQIMQYLWMSFSPDGKLLLTLGAAPDYLLTNWMWEKIRPLHSVRSASGAGVDDISSLATPNSMQTSSPAMHQCSFSTYDPTLVVVIGHGRISLYRLSSSMQFEPIASDFKDISQHDFISHAWLKDSLVLGTQAGIVFVCSPLGSTFVQAINLNTVGVEPGTVSHQHYHVGEGSVNSTSQASALCLSGFNHGLVCGSRHGLVFLFDLVSSDNEHGALLASCKRLHVRQSTTADVQNIALNPSEQLLAVTTSASRAYFLSLANTDILKPDEIKFESLLESFHSGPILGMDVCIRKPLVVTCGADCTIRVWNYLDRTMECVKNFTEQCLSVAIHPTGFQLVIGFTDKLRLMNLLMDDIRPCKEINVKNCREVQFSSGGHMFAAVHGSMIVVYSTYTCDLISTLRGHNQRVSSIQWTHDDQTVITSGSDGAVYEFSAKSGQREREYVQKGCKYYQAVCSHDGKIYAVGNDRVLKEISDSSVQKEVDAGTVLTQIILSHPVERMLFAGTEQGQVRSFKFPLTGHCQDYQCHSAAVNRLRLSRDDTMLFSAGADGCLAVFDVREQEGRSSSSAASQIPWSEEVLVTRSDLEERATLTNDMKNKVDELTLHNEYQLRLQEMSHNEKLKEVKESCQVALEEQKKIYDRLKDEKQDMEMDYEEAVKKLEEMQAATLALAKQEHQEQIMKEVEAYHELELEMKKEEEEWDRQMHIADERHQDALDERQVELEEMLHREKDRVERLLEEKEAILREFNETKRQLEQDTDVEIQELKEKFDQQLAAERETTLRLKGENGIMKKRFSSLSNDIEDQKEELKMMSEKEESVRGQITLLRQEIDRNKSEISTLDATIGDKERTIYELKKKNQEMEKYKFVLDYQIKELKREIEPHECKISEMQEQEEKMDEELELLHSDNGTLKQAVEDLKKQTNEIQSSINEARHQGQHLRAQSERQMFDLDHVVHLEDAAMLEGVTQLVATYVQANATMVDREPDIEAEYNKQSTYLRREIDRLKRSVENDSKRRSRETHRVMEQNSELIKEINTLRKELNIKRQGIQAVPVQPGQSSQTPIENPRQIISRNQVRISELQARLKEVGLNSV